MNIGEVLQGYSNRALEAMAMAHDLHEFAPGGPGFNRARAVDALRRAVVRPETIARAIRQVGHVERAALKLLLGGGRTMTADRARQALLRQGTRLRLVAPGESARVEADPAYVGLPRFEDALARAAVCGLIFSRQPVTEAQISFEPGRQLLVPDAIADAIEAHDLLGDEEPVAETAAAMPAHVVAASAPDFQRDLGRYWRFIRKRGDMRLTAQGWLYKADFKHLLGALNAPEGQADEAANGRAWFIRRLLEVLGELRRPLGGATVKAVEAENSFLQLPMAERVQRAFAAWLNGGVWNELAHLDLAQIGMEPHRAPPQDLKRARAVVLRRLANASGGAAGVWQPDRWVATEEFIEQFKRDDYQFLFPRGLRGVRAGLYGARNLEANAQTPYFDMNNPYGVTFPDILDEAAGWDLAERAFILHVLSGPLHWLGLVDLGYPGAGGETRRPIAARLTPVGAWLLNLADPPPFLETGGRVLVQPNFTVLAMEPVSDSVLAELEHFADLQGGDRAVSYVITRQSVYRGQRAGRDVPRIVAFLESHQGGAIPPNVKRSLEEWQQQHARITFRRHTRVLQYADDATRDAVRSVLDGAEAIGAGFDLLQDARPTDGIVAALRDAGWAPLITRADDPELDGCLRVGESGDIAFKYGVANVFAVGRLSAFAEHSSDALRSSGALRVTAQSVRAALANGMAVEEILATLAQMNDGALPDRLETAIREWSSFYGAATLREVVLLELSSADVLQHALEDKALANYLLPVEGSLRPIALVDARHAARVRELLQERGIALKEAS